MHPNSEANVIADDNPCEPEKSEELQNVYDVSINEQSQDIFTFHEGILTVAIKQKNNKQVSHTDEVNYIIDHSQTPNMVICVNLDRSLNYHMKLDLLVH
jgi:hypothetical protein